MYIYDTDISHNIMLDIGVSTTSHHYLFTVAGLKCEYQHDDGGGGVRMSGNKLLLSCFYSQRLTARAEGLSGRGVSGRGACASVPVTASRAGRRRLGARGGEMIHTAAF